MNNVSDFWPVKIVNDVTVCVQPTMTQMTTYVLLEQEDWFEDEMDFVRAYIQPDMNVLDIGANHGVYSLSIAKKIQTGHIWAFEPTQAPLSKLSKSIDINEFSEKITLVDAGLSDSNKTAEIFTSFNSELNSIYGNGQNKEVIRLESLDSYLSSEKINKDFDFVKLDAEGEEINVLKGGATFFTEQSPLVMFELKHGNEVNHGLIEAFINLGYSIYRLLPDLNILVDYESSFTDGYILNLFACKPDRAKQLTERGLLASNSQIQEKINGDLSIAVQGLQKIESFPYSGLCKTLWSDHLAEVPLQYTEAFAACLSCYDTTLEPALRVALLSKAIQLLNQLSQDNPNLDLAVLLLKIHVCHLLGERSKAVFLIGEAFKALGGGIYPKWPFLPPSQTFFYRTPTQDINTWLIYCLKEFREKRCAFSSYFNKDAIHSLAALINDPNIDMSIARRCLLAAKSHNLSINIPEEHPLFDENRSPNAKIWKLICK